MRPPDIDSDRWRAYLFEVHSPETLRAWAQRLSLFRFCRAVGGHANDGDELLLVYAYQTPSELSGFFNALGAPLIQHSEAPPQAIPGVSYTWEQSRKFPSLIPNTTWLQQPGHCKLAGEDAFAWCTNQQIQISIAHGFEVTEAEVQRAERLERALRGVALARVDPPVVRRHCVCPAYYPELFE
ncbi:MAG TPA: hypothetical protein VFZ61_12115 [Polyangiales bacterium]